MVSATSLAPASCTCTGFRYFAAKPRRPDTTYKVRTRGVFMLQPGPAPKFVTIACSRTSIHGEIGVFYESQFQTWLTRIVENCFL